MLGILLTILIYLWFLGAFSLDGTRVLDHVVLSVGGQGVVLWHVFVLLVMAWVINLLPRPFRKVALFFTVLWVLSIVGVLSLSGFSTGVLLAIILGLSAYVLQGNTHESIGHEGGEAHAAGR